MLLDLATSAPEAPAVTDLDRSRTRAELVDRAIRLGRLWRGAGVGPGDHVASVLGNRVEAVEAVLAATLSGVWLSPVNRHLTPEEVRYVIEDSGAAAIVTDPDHETVVRSVAGGRPVLVAGDDLDAALADGSDEPFALSGPPGGTMLYTSGTTGRPKGVRRAVASDLGSQLRSLAASGRALGLRGAAPHLVAGPLHHAAPLGFAMIDLHNGAPLVIMRRWDERRALELMAEHEVGTTHLVPTMFVRLLRLPQAERAAFDPTSLSTVLHGAAPISIAVKERMIEWWGPVLVEYWGGSEGGTVTVATSQEWLAHPGTVGRALPSHEVFAADDAGQRLGPGETGQLWCRNTLTDQVFEYHRAPEKTEAAFRAPGTYTLGDIGRVDGDGYVYLTDRTADVIITGGVNVYPTEVAQVLAEHPAVADVAVFGIPDAEWGEQVKAVVELLPGQVPGPALAAELEAFARAHLAGFKVPRTVDFDEELPRQATGKLAIRSLRDRYWPSAGPRI